MIDPTATLAIQRSELSLADLVFSGNDGDRSIVTMNEPARLARVIYANSRNLHGSLPLQSTYEQANINALLRLEGTTAAALDAAKTELLNALGQFAYNVVQTVNGVAKTYSADTGSLTPADLAYEDMRRNVAFMQVSIPVYPIASA